MGEILNFKGETYSDIDPEKVISAAQGKGLQTVAIVGIDEDGNDYLASSTGDASLIVFMLEKAKLRVVESVNIAE